ncbi:phosphoribosylformylglycinamidine synthase [Brachyspira aalborgi]|jgi:phosphoribosylformylglycinamidine synthase|uniref:Phosphoribosylformylglycinamidine synthase n=1 Tax=Brachyspira aalborgi TaxID=29522 RepID=A0AB38PY59_9SPIR|nr:phosphoribosylformylglycinamidine synthase [Brachyspira aalborgi]CCY74145.1 phosphoribosylformylglycinamidine synthase [Brachyspira sp. CAG:700]TXJ15387.1 phosphoribosylformylglycinamidine synthase [Brachyspira aalborgi]TXJ17976.1 phosphoribosylformylglycinamidine synthase [Brachyspira aalborgi]TXJ23928.1 phosphoribosylformylglycinamidine synthase [Brachyspira aalborgi]TXJ32149.1 phosphoribosylformylglycinamidine synthase [Brachyspira aalborgi]
MVYRIFVEKKDGFNNEAKSLYSDITEFLGIKRLNKLRIFNRYDAENISEKIFDYAIKTVFSEPQLDNVYKELNINKAFVFATEYLPGQFDQREESASQCIQIISQGKKPLIKTAKVYALYGNLTKKDIEEIKKYIINPVEMREANFLKPGTLKEKYKIPKTVKMLKGFINLNDKELFNFIKSYDLAMDFDDLKFCREYFLSEKRNPTITEIKVIDTYWSDHCRHTTFLTIIDNVEFEDELLQETYKEYLTIRKELKDNKPICLMDLATVLIKYFKKKGKLKKLDESEEINACSVKINIEVDGKTENWILLFKNETHNHPTEIEPFGGAATCIGGAIRDPLSGRGYVYGAMRITGAANPTVSISKTLKGKLPQRKIVTTAAEGYSSYGNQIGLATGIVDEIYHKGYLAKHMEIGAVIAAVPEKNIKRKKPIAGDIVILIGGSTGRDGCGGATGSSKSHTEESIEICGAEVQKGNAPEERKLQRLFRNQKVSKLIKKCNDFGAGGVSVAIGELADGIDINLNAILKKYEGLDGTELAISESQERMAVVIDKKDIEKFLSFAKEENLQAVKVATIKKESKLTMFWNGKKIVDISREFLNSNGAKKHINAKVKSFKNFDKKIPKDFVKGYKSLLSDINVCSKRGLSERFDSTIGAGTVLMPFGGKFQLTPIQAMVQKISVEKKETNNCSLMSYGFNPFIMEKSPYHGAYFSVIESVCKLIATGSNFKEIYLTFQEYFEKLGKDKNRWGKPLSALLGAFKAQKELGICAIGGKDSMSGSFENINVPPTLVSFAISTAKTKNIISPEFKKSKNKVYLIKPKYDKNRLPETKSLLSIFYKINNLMKNKKILSCYTLTYGGIAEAVYKMCIGNGFGFEYNSKISLKDLFKYNYGAFIIETEENIDEIYLGKIISEKYILYKKEKIDLKKLSLIYENKLEKIYSCNIKTDKKPIKNFSYKTKNRIVSKIKIAKPKVIIPIFPGTNCEYESAKAFEYAGAKAKIMVINNLSSYDIKKSVDNFSKELKTSQIIFIPGGFSGGDEPDGSGKFITAFFRNHIIKEETIKLLDKRGGLILGICNGFQALIKLGLVPFGKIIETDENCPTLTFNEISRHQSKIVRTRIASNKSPWLSYMNVGDIVSVPISHGEGRFIASEELIKKLSENGQIATQYIDFEGNASNDIRFNPNGSIYAIEGITSPDGRVFGKMGHSERIGNGLYKNVLGNYDIKMFKSAIEYFK